MNKKKLTVRPAVLTGSESRLRRRSAAILEEVADRRTAYPTDLSIGQLAERGLMIEPRLLTRDDGSSMDVTAVAGELKAGRNVLVLGDPGAGKTVLSFLVHRIVLADSGSHPPLPLAVVDLIARDGIDLAGVAEAAGLNQEELAAEGPPIFVVDGIDEALAGGSSSRAIADVLTRLAELGTILVTSRSREFETDLMAQLDLGMFHRIADLQPWAMSDFETYVHQLAEGDQLSEPEATLAWVRSDAALIELTKRPLLARMLIFVAQQHEGDVPENASKLYQVYLRRLAAWVEQRLAKVGCSGRNVYDAWRNFAWSVFRERRLTADTMSGDVPARFFSSQMSLACAYEVTSGILDYVGSRGELRSRFRHYTLYEFLVADWIADALDRESRQASGSSLQLFESDLPREVRRHLSRLIDRTSPALSEFLLSEFARLPDIADQATRRVVGNLLAYYLGRVEVQVERVRVLLAAEDDVFLRNSLSWSLANLSDVGAVASFIDDMEADESGLIASWNRGYLRYYYGDQLRDRAVPPYTDDDPSNDWPKTREKTFEMLDAAHYADEEPAARRALDVFTCLDLCRFHGDRLTPDERRVVLAAIQHVGQDAAILGERLAALLEQVA